MRRRILVDALLRCVGIGVCVVVETDVEGVHLFLVFASVAGARLARHSNVRHSLRVGGSNKS